MPVAWKPRAADLVEALRAHYLPADALMRGQDEWSLLTEVPSLGSPAHDQQMPERADFSDTAAWQQAYADWQDASGIRSIDVLLLRNWRSGKVPFERIAIECKTSRSDFHRETPGKRGAWEALAHRFAYCAPRGLLTPEDIPAGCWLIEIDEHPCTSADGGVHAQHAPTRAHWNRKVKGARRTPAPIVTDLAVYFARIASRATEAIRAGDGGGASARTEQDLRHAQQRLHVLQAREASNRDRVREALALLAPLLPQVCADCGAPLRAHVPTHGPGSWKHRSHAVEEACLQGRIARHAELAEASGDPYRYWPHQPVEPLTIRVERERAEQEAHEARQELLSWQEHQRTA